MTNYFVKQPPIMLAARAMLSLVVIAAWLLAANHCVVAGFVPPARVASAEHAPCPGHPAPAQDNENGGCEAVSCCESLAAPVAFTKAAAQYDASAFATHDFPGSVAFDLGEQLGSAIEEVDTGPPRPPSFAESVLQRSLLAHAPPFAV